MEAYDTNDVLLARKSETIKVTAGETAECSIALKLFASSILDSGYILWKYESSAYNFYREDSITEKASDICYCYGEPFGAVEDLKSNWYCVGKSSNDNGTGVLYRYDADSKKEQIAEISDFGYYFTDPLYYDPTEDALWFASYNNDILSLSKNKSPSSISSVNNINAVSGIDFSGKIGLAFAVQGSSLYLVYTDLSNFYFQYGKISGDGPFVFEPIGSPKTVSDLDLGVSGAITDVAILYDGTVYVLVSNVGNSSGDSEDSFNYNYALSNTMYSRGALLKIQSTSSGFEVVDTLGWTDSWRSIASVGDATYSGTDLQPLTAYIPSLSESGNKFYGPRRFVAIKPKAIAIADCGANFVMPNHDEQQKGKMFAHNRVVTVSLSNFAISNVTELKNIKFSDLTISGTGTSGGYIDCAGCTKEDIKEQ
ncbi:hypothetical protein [Treponema succinifaciens]|uniref:hypothetical protein n=1 Tax=Treponema succinifaciens TaxID=167 RepID=UPI0023F01E40|nr:hypothetical protein [Treponema succinifaciens]